MRKRDNISADPWDRDFYETGSTKPPKQNNGVIAMLLVAMILLVGACRMLGILNLHLLRQLAEGEQEHHVLTLFEEENPEPVAETIAKGKDHLPLLGVTGQTVSDFDRRYYELPQGVLVTEVAEDRCGWTAGIRIGDVICSLEQRQITTLEDLSAALEDCRTGQQLQVELYRPQTGETLQTTVTVTDEEME